LRKYLTLDKLSNDNYFKQAENTIKIVVYYIASVNAEKKSQKMQSNSTDHDTRKEMIVLFDKLHNFDTSQLLPIETDVAKNPFYSSKVAKVIADLNAQKSRDNILLNEWKIKPVAATTVPVTIRKTPGELEEQLEQETQIEIPPK